ncbi:MAG: FmdB family zinc ribbon protein [Terriglobales bacterium]
MPLYEYQCTRCGKRVEVIQSFSADPLTTCEACQGPLEKLISASAFQFKGSGWYITDYSKKSSPASTKNGEGGAEGKSESKSDTSESKSESKSDSKAESKSEPKPESKSKSKAETKSESKPDAKSSKPAS